MTQYFTMIKTLTLMHAIIIAVVAIVLALFVIQQGIVNTFLWMIGLGALAIGAINKASYG